MRAGTPQSVVLACALAAAMAAQAQVYKTVDENGNVTFSDTPSATSKKITVQPVQTYSLPKKAKPEPSDEKAAADAKSGGQTTTPAPQKLLAVKYELSIASPADDQTVRENAGSITVAVSLKPDLQGGDLIQFLLDGKPAGAATASTSTVLPFVDRGSHSIGARVVSTSGAVKASASPVTVHLKRFFIKN